MTSATAAPTVLRSEPTAAQGRITPPHTLLLLSFSLLLHLFILLSCRSSYPASPMLLHLSALYFSPLLLSCSFSLLLHLLILLSSRSGYSAPLISARLLVPPPLLLSSSPPPPLHLLLHFSGSFSLLVSSCSSSPLLLLLSRCSL